MRYAALSQVWSNGEDQDDGDVMVMIKCLDLEKKKKKNKKAQGKGISGRSHFVLVIKTLSMCDHI